MIWIPIPFLLVASFTDIKNRKIKNFTTYPMILAGLVYHGLESAEKLAVSLIIGITFGFILCFLPGFKIGMGDLKLVIACEIWLADWYPAVYFVVLTIALVAIFYIASFLKEAGPSKLINQLRDELFDIFIVRTFPETKKKYRIPLAPFLLIAFIVTSVLI